MSILISVFFFESRPLTSYPHNVLFLEGEENFSMPTLFLGRRHFSLFPPESIRCQGLWRKLITCGILAPAEENERIESWRKIIIPQVTHSVRTYTAPPPPPVHTHWHTCQFTLAVGVRIEFSLNHQFTFLVAWLTHFFFSSKKDMGNTKVPNLMTPREVGFLGHPGWVVRCTSRSHSMDCIEFSTVTHTSNFHARRCLTSNDNRCAQRYNNEVHNSQHW